MLFRNRIFLGTVIFLEQFQHCKYSKITVALFNANPYAPHKLNRQCDARQQKKLHLDKRKEIINNGSITDNWKPVHYLKIHVYCVGSWYLKDR
jgi:hypothetical protein